MVCSKCPEVNIVIYCEFISCFFAFSANAQYGPALKFYLEAGVVSSDFFTTAVPQSVYDDQVYKKMMRCCSSLQCFTQVRLYCCNMWQMESTLPKKQKHSQYQWQILYHRFMEQRTGPLFQELRNF
jgi:hypothetical protein